MAAPTDDAFVLREPVPAEPLLPDPGLPLWAWGLIGLVAVGLIVGLILLLRRGKKPAGVNMPALREAAYRRALTELEGKPGETIQEAATTVSIALRRYLATVSGDPALFETHEEFVARHESLASYPEDLRQSTAEGFSHLARLKYGREASGDPVALYTAARQLLERLHQHRPSPSSSSSPA
ncbi:hypothetical protein [Haloferula sp. BvORR071]|uniref:hypothetical protein n=1 Tax=Haloferula sp. BvORR071 TaxID=1396141 RepID=UPI0005553941|nr:hypothetical protein [Haloferula sp. BvORR071]